MSKAEEIALDALRCALDELVALRATTRVVPDGVSAARLAEVARAFYLRTMEDAPTSEVRAETPSRCVEDVRWIAAALAVRVATEPKEKP